MLIEEARWLGRTIHACPVADISPMLNVGSSTGDFRTREQPWIDRYIFATASQSGLAIKHLDVKPAAGVDLVGDLTAPEFLNDVARMRFKSVFCSNLFEHVPNREQIAALLLHIIPVGGFLFVSCPYRYPYHPDPIDTLFRPDVAELTALFPGTRIHQQAIVNGGTYASSLMKDFLRSPLGICQRLFTPAAPPHAPNTTTPTSPAAPSRVRRLAPWLFRRFKATCVVLEKTANHGPQS